MDTFILFEVLRALAAPLIIGGLIYFLFFKKKTHHIPEKFAMHAFYLLGFFFLGLTLWAINLDAGEPLSGQTIGLITSLAGLVFAYRFKTPYTLFFSLVGFLAWWGSQALEWADLASVKPTVWFSGVMFISLLYFAVGAIHKKSKQWKEFSGVYYLLGFIPPTLALFIFSTQAGLEGIEELTTGKIFFSSLQLTILFILLIIAIIGTSIFTLIKNLLTKYEVIAIGVLAIVFGILLFVPEQTALTGLWHERDATAAGLWWGTLYNVVLFFELLGLILLGYKKRHEWMVNMGAFLLFIFIIVKYFDWFFSFLDKSLFFIIAGILMFGVGFLMEKTRRFVLSEIKHS